MLKNILIAVILFTSFIGITSCSKEETVAIKTPAELLDAKNWVTTKVTDVATNQVIPNTDAKAVGYVGYAYYDSDGMFFIYTLADVLRISGTWSLTPDGKKRILIFNNATGVQQVRIVDIKTLTDALFVYRVTDANGTFDVEHIPTDHVKPK
jgi:hypothetical protein